MNDHIVVGADPGMADGKPVAVVAVLFSGDRIKLVYAEPAREIGKEHGLIEKLLIWIGAVKCAHLFAQVVYPDASVSIACEAARGHGAKGYTLQALVHAISDLVAEGFVVSKPIHPSTVKTVTGNGKATAEEVAMFVNVVVEGADALPETDDYDWQAAAAVAIARDKQLREEWLKQQGE